MNFADSKKKNVFLAVTVAAILASLMIAVSFFLPYASANAEYREQLDSVPNGVTIPGLDMSADDMKDISLFEFVKIFSSAEALGQPTDTATIHIVLDVFLGIFALGNILFSVLRKPVPLLIFNGLTFGVFSLISWDFKDRGALPSVTYDIGIAHYIYYICAAVVLVSAIVMLVLKIQQKKQLQTAAVPNT